MLDFLPSTPQPAGFLAPAGALLSLAALALLALLCRDCARRASRFRPLSAAGLDVRPRWVARAWLLLLVVAFLAGLNGLPVASEARSTTPAPVAAGPAPAGDLVRGTAASTGAGEEPSPPARATRTSLRLPFWVRSSLYEEAADGGRLAGSTHDTLQVPWIFLLAAGLYGLLGIRRSGPAPAAGEAAPGTSRTEPRRPPGGSGAPGRGSAPGRGGTPARSGTPGRGILALLALAAAVAAAPAPRHATASDCGGIDGTLCYIYEKCERKLIFFEKCTTEYAYYPDYV